MINYYENIGNEIIHERTVLDWAGLTTKQIQYFCDAIHELRNIMKTDTETEWIRPVNVDIKFIEFVDENAAYWHTVHRYLKIALETNIPSIINKLEEYVEILRKDLSRLYGVDVIIPFGINYYNFKK